MMTKYNKTSKWLTSVSLIICQLSFSVALFTSCSDFVEADSKDYIAEDQVFTQDDDVFKGMLGILNRMQEAGDQALWLTDTRCNFLETTTAAPADLKAIAHYEATEGNPYADPSCYYAIVSACNDYVANMERYHHDAHSMSEAAENNFEALLSSALRVKVWAYYMLGRIYGQAYWFDKPLTERYELSDQSVFTLCDMQQLVEKCIGLLDQGIDVDGLHIAADLTPKWKEWLNPENTSATEFTKWLFFTPPYLLMRAELVSWRCNYKTEDAAQADWTWVRDALLEHMYKAHNNQVELPGFDINSTAQQWNGYIYQCNVPLSTSNNGHTLNSDGSENTSAPAYDNYSSIFCSDDEIGNHFQLVSFIMYDYEHGQRNRIVQYLCPTYPGGDCYFLRPSAYGLSLYNEDDIRSLTQGMVVNTLGGQPAVTKYYYYYNTGTAVRKYQYKKDNIFEIEPNIPLFRGHDFHFLLAEAETHLGNYEVASILLNKGMENSFADRDKAREELPANFSPYYRSWFGSSGGYGNCGIVGAARGTYYDLPVTLAEAQSKGVASNDLELKRLYDWALADEYLKEYVCEGKSYSYLCKMGDRYSHAGRGSESDARSAVAARIAPKYESGAMQQKVKSYIASNGYFILWDLKDGLTK